MPPIYNDLEFKTSCEADVWNPAVNFNIFHTQDSANLQINFTSESLKSLLGLPSDIIKILLFGRCL